MARTALSTGNWKVPWKTVEDQELSLWKITIVLGKKTEGFGKSSRIDPTDFGQEIPYRFN